MKSLCVFSQTQIGIICTPYSGEVLQRYPHILNHRDAGSVDKAFKQMPWQYPGDRPSYNYEVIDLPRDVIMEKKAFLCSVTL